MTLAELPLLRAAPSRRIALAPLALPAICAGVLLLSLPLLFARPANLTSDESLYLAEARDIASGDLTYPSNEPVTHRAPLYPAALAPAFALAGENGAYAVQRAVVIVNALLLALIAARAAGALAAAIGGLTAAASSYLNGLGTTLYVDPLQCTFMLLAFAAMLECARRDGSARWGAAAGIAVGLAFLVKESAVQWAPLGAVACLAVPWLRSRAGLRAALAFTLAFGAAIAPWWLWVWAQTGDLYMLGEPSLEGAALLLAAGGSLAAMAVILSAAPRLDAARALALGRLAIPAVAAAVAGWGAFIIWGLERHSGWPYPADYLRNVPEYLRTVAPAAQPFLLIAAAWAWCGWRARDAAAPHRLALLAAALFAPFAIFAANRGLQLRDALPLVYLGYVVLGVAAAEALALLRRTLASPAAEALALAAVAAIGAVFATQQVLDFRDDNAEASAIGVRADNWDSAFVDETAAWMESNLPSGARVMTSRLYFSSLHVKTDGRFEIHQLPTVRVAIEPSSPVVLDPRSNMFRWGDEEITPATAGEQWLMLRQFPGKGYWIGLRERELLAYIRDHRIDYIILTGDDLGFSGLWPAAYLSGHSAFTLIDHRSLDPANQLFAYRVDREALETRGFSLALPPASADALLRQESLAPGDLSRLLGQDVRVTDGDQGLSPRETWAAAAGVDLALD